MNQSDKLWILYGVVFFASIFILDALSSRKERKRLQEIEEDLDRLLAKITPENRHPES